MMKKIIVMIILLLCTTTVSAFVITPMDMSPMVYKISSGDYEAALSSRGGFTALWDSQFLFYDGDMGKVSFQVDGVMSTNRKFRSANVVVVAPNEATAHWTHGNVLFFQTITVFPDKIRVKMDMTNQDDSSHNIDLRYLLDTKIGSNDNPLSFEEGCTTDCPHPKEVEVKPNSYFYAVKENFPTLASKFFWTNQPDKLMFVDMFGSSSAATGASNTNYAYTVNPDGLIKDSGVLMYWEGMPVAPGETKSIEYFVKTETLDGVPLSENGNEEEVPEFGTVGILTLLMGLGIFIVRKRN